MILALLKRNSKAHILNSYNTSHWYANGGKWRKEGGSMSLNERFFFFFILFIGVWQTAKWYITATIR